MAWPGSLLPLEDLDQADDAAGVSRPQDQGLVEDGHGGVELALFDADVGALVELLQGRVEVPGLPVEPGERLARVVVLPVELDDLLEDGDGLGGLARPGQPAGDGRVDVLGVGDEALLGVEVAELEGVNPRCRD